MDRIATASTYQSALLGILNAQNRQATAQAQVSSGYIGSDLKAYAGHADTLTAVKTLDAKLGAYSDAADRASDRLDAQDTALNGVNDAAGVRKGVLDAVANSDGSTLMATLQGWYAQAVDSLNTNVGGDYLFAGGQTQTKPIASDQLSDIPLTGSITPMFANDQHKATARLDDNITLTTGVLASDAGTPLFSALQQIVAFNAGPNGPFSGQLTSAQTTFLQGVLPTLQAAGSASTAQVASNAVAQNRVSSAQAILSDRKTATDGIVGKLAEADPAKAAIDLQLASTALQASAQVFSVLQGSSLLNVLTPGV